MDDPPSTLREGPETVGDLVVSVAAEGDAAGMVEVIHAAFGARPALDPPSTADTETVASVTERLRSGGGIHATVDGRPAGAILVQPVGSEVARFTRVSVHPDFQRRGIASAMVAEAETLVARLGYRRAEVLAREELAHLVEFWRQRGFAVDRPVPHGMALAKDLPLVVRVPTAQAMRALGERLAARLAPGDVIIATGDLGAGKTTLAQGVGRGLGTTGRVISPTFVLSRIHPSTTGRPRLVHVDAYRLGGPGELDDLDLDATVADSVTLVEWGRGVAEGLAADRLEIDIWRAPSDDGADDERLVTLRGVGPRWASDELAGLTAA